MRIWFLLILVTLQQSAMAVEPTDLVAFYRFYDHKASEHCYAYNDRELAAWRTTPHFQEHTVLGQLAVKELPGTTRLWRGFDAKTRRQFYYLIARGPNYVVDNENFVAYVWKTPGDGRIPVYGSTWIDGGDVYFNVHISEVRKFGDDTEKALAVKRKSLGVNPVFYVYPPPEELPKDLVPLIRFQDTAQNQSVYACNEQDATDWRAQSEQEERCLGLVSAKELPGTKRLFRLVREVDKKHFYYVTIPTVFKTIQVDEVGFVAYVWTTPGIGRIPVFGNAGEDGSDVSLVLSKDELLVTSEASKAEKRRSLGIAPLFYVYPAPKEQEPK